MVDGRQVCKPTGTDNRRAAQKIYDVWRAEISQGRFDLLRKAPTLKDWAEKYLKSVDHPNTRRRYKSSKENLVAFFGEESRLDHISIARIEQFKQERRTEGVKGATINRDLRFLSQLMKQAERERYLARSPFDRTKFFLNESRDRRKPHVVTWEEEAKILAVARPRIRVLVVLGVETGMRTGEMLGLKWTNVDVSNDVIYIEKSKTESGVRSVPMSQRCKTELLRWRNLVGPEFSEWVFPNFENRRHKLQGGRKAWASTLKKAGLSFFPIYYLRHTFASRLTTAGVSPLTIAQMLGHSSTQIVPRYAQVMDHNRLDAMKKLDILRQTSNEVGAETNAGDAQLPGSPQSIPKRTSI
jgi:integrase